jgi:hypothetical protein
MLHFREGVKDEEFAQALEDFTAFLEKNRDFLKILITEGGEHYSLSIRALRSTTVFF